MVVPSAPSTRRITAAHTLEEASGDGTCSLRHARLSVANTFPLPSHRLPTGPEGWSACPLAPQATTAARTRRVARCPLSWGRQRESCGCVEDWRK